MKTFYISDLHFSHANVIKFDNRPFSNIEEMNQTLIKNWNETVSKEDKVYILGDFCWGKKDEWIKILKQLNGQKFLVKGNHDLKQYGSDLKKYLSGIYDYHEIEDDDRQVIMCHYPMPFYKKDYDPNTYHLYGHVHVTLESTLMEKIKELIFKADDRGISANKCQFYNVGCMMPWMDYKPRTLDEIVKAAYLDF